MPRRISVIFPLRPRNSMRTCSKADGSVTCLKRAASSDASSFRRSVRVIHLIKRKTLVLRERLDFFLNRLDVQVDTGTGFNFRYIKYALTEPVLAKSFQKNSDVRKGRTPYFFTRLWRI